MPAERATAPTGVLKHPATESGAGRSVAWHRDSVQAPAHQTTPLLACALLLGLVSLADIAAAALDPRLPAAAVAMVFMLLLFAVRRGPDTGTARLYEAAAPILPILFVPAGVGVFQIGGLTPATWLALLLIVGGVTLCVVAVVGALAQRLLQVEGSK